MTKKELRKSLKAQRNSLPSADISAMSRKISERLSVSDEFLKAQTVFVYISFSSEVETREIIEYALSLNKTVLVPKISGDTMEAVIFPGFSALKNNIYGIPEPEKNAAFSGRIDVTLVPGLAFCREGFRIGYGGGYYDKFLKAHPCTKIALAFSSQIKKELPVEEHDVKMDFIITEKETITVDGN